MATDIYGFLTKINIYCAYFTQILEFIDALIPVIRKVLCDDVQQVRKAAAETFHHLHDRTGAYRIYYIFVFCS